MKKSKFLALIACLVIAGCGNATNTQTQTQETPTSSYESMEAAPSDSAATPSDAGSDGDSYENTGDNGGGGTGTGGYDDPSNEDMDFDSSPSSSGTPGFSGNDGSDGVDSDDSEPAGGSDSSPSTTPSSSPSSSVADRDTGDSNTDTDTDTDADSSDIDTDTDDNDSSDAGKTEEKTPEDDSANQQDNTGYGNIFFVGDSRTVDMFDGNVSEVYDLNVGGIRVFARDGCHCAYLTDVLGSHSLDEFDTLVSWLGCNDNNDAALYEQVYQNLLNQGKQVVICTVGPTNDAFLNGDFDTANYPDAKMVAFNQEITSWASSHGVKVIDLYTFVKGNIEISPDGIHYNPKPTTAIWNYILSNL
ncbi:MAG: hypothetical protein K6E70_01415 [Butyrivibrio sp.]|nr:hypothetical protein [Butyrivibrio sp.]